MGYIMGFLKNVQFRLNSGKVEISFQKDITFL